MKESGVLGKTVTITPVTLKDLSIVDHMASMNSNMEQSKAIHKPAKNIIMEAVAAQKEVESISLSTVDGVSLYEEDDEQLIRDYVEGTIEHIFKLKRHLNTLVGFNKLPAELLTYIVVLTKPSKEMDEKHPYTPYTWVCYHWRSVLIQNPNLWTSIQLKAKGEPITPYIQELLTRSQPLKLDVKLTIHSNQFVMALQGFFAKESSRIQTLTLISNQPTLIGRVLGGQRFPVLREVFHHGNPGAVRDGIGNLLSSLVASDHLETLECNAWYDIPQNVMDQLPVIFSRIQKLSIGFFDPVDIPPVLNSLQNNTKLHTLSIQLHLGLYEIYSGFVFSSRTTLSELRSLSINNIHILEAIRTPRLSYLDIRCLSAMSPITFKDSVFRDFDFSALKYLQILDCGHPEYKAFGGYSILGVKETPTHHIARAKNSPEKDYFAEGLNPKPLNTGHILSEGSGRLDYFQFSFVSKNTEPEVVGRTLKEALPLILPRLTSLLELRLSPTLIERPKIHFDEILPHVSSIEKLIIPYVPCSKRVPSGSPVRQANDHIGLIQILRLLSDVSICPQLKYLFYMTLYFRPTKPEELQKLADNYGKSLADCLRSRHKVYGDILKHIILGQCPPLPDAWVKELQKFGTTVVTEKDVGCCGQQVEEF